MTNHQEITAPPPDVLDRVLARHRALYESDAPLVVADYEHALDTWQWTRRLDANASSTVQVAALFHDVERLESEALVRVEHRARDYDEFKRSHAARGADLTRTCLEGLLDPLALDRVAYLIERHETPGEDPELALLNEADALSFFAVNSAGFVDYYGAFHARAKVLRSLARLGERGRRFLRDIALRPDVRAWVTASQASEKPRGKR